MDNVCSCQQWGLFLCRHKSYGREMSNRRGDRGKWNQVSVEAMRMNGLIDFYMISVPYVSQNFESLSSKRQRYRRPGHVCTALIVPQLNLLYRENTKQRSWKQPSYKAFQSLGGIRGPTCEPKRLKARRILGGILNFQFCLRNQNVSDAKKLQFYG